jgi:hypothetical protein
MRGPILSDSLELSAAVENPRENGYDPEKAALSCRMPPRSRGRATSCLALTPEN